MISEYLVIESTIILLANVFVRAKIVWRPSIYVKLCFDLL